MPGASARRCRRWLPWQRRAGIPRRRRGCPSVPPAGRSALPAGLSEREVEVLRLVAQGLTNAEVAAQLYLSPRTVDAHLRRIYDKLGTSSRSAAVRFALEHDLA